MGAFFGSYSIPGDVHEVVDQKIKEWLSQKGFQEPADPVLDHCRDGERAYYLFWNDRWTVVLFSHIEEEERLLFELSKDTRPVLHLWVFDSDLWGYELYVKNRPVAAFNSNPEYSGTSELADAPNDIALLLEQCSIHGLTVSEIERLQKKGGLFKEQACTAFAKAVGAGPAASQYGYQSESEPPAPDFSVAHRRFRKRGFDPMRNFNLHAETAESNRAEMPSPAPMPPLSPGFRALMEIMKIAAIPVGWLFRIYLARKIKAGGIPGLAGAAGAPQIPREYAFEGGRLVNPKRRCRITLPEGAAPSSGPGILPFAIRGEEIYSKTMSAEETKRRLTGSYGLPIEEETNFWIGSLPAKSIRARIPAKPERIRCEYFIQAPPAVYYFSQESKTAPGPADLEVFRNAIGSFEIIHPSQTG